MRSANNRATLKACATHFPTYSTTNLECDELPFQSTYEGARLGPDRFSVRPISEEANSSGGGQLSGFYRYHRILDTYDQFWVLPGTASVTSENMPSSGLRQHIEARARVEHGFFLITGADDPENDPRMSLGHPRADGLVVTATGLGIPSRAAPLTEVRVVLQVWDTEPATPGARAATLHGVGPYLHVAGLDGSVFAVGWLAPGHEWTVAVEQTGDSSETWRISVSPATSSPATRGPGTVRARVPSESSDEIKDKVFRRTGFRPL